MNTPATLQEKHYKLVSSCLLCALIPVLVWAVSVAIHVSGEHLQLSALLFVLSVLLILTWLTLARAVSSMNETRRVLNGLLQETTPQFGTDAQLATHVGEKLSAQTLSLETELDGFKIIFSAMGDGILVVDSRRNVLFTNPATRKILGIADDAPLARSLIQLTQHAELLANIEMSIVAMQACSFEFQVPITDTQPPQKRYVQAHCAPYKNEKQALAGAVAVLHDITDLRRLERMRTEFVSNVSHELRTPLTSLLGYLETLEAGGYDDKDQAQSFLKICSRQAESLSRIVEDLLRLSKLENPQSEVADASVSLQEVVSAAVENCENIADKRGIKLSQEIPAEEIMINGDRGLLVQALSNLIENAINYNREHGSVTVRLTPVQKAVSADLGELSDGAEWDVAVSDTGIGIPAHALQRVFERFYRVDKARSRSQGGTGLGLAIVKHIALAHGASVHVESEVGRGTTFFIRFKCGKSQKVRNSARMIAAEEGELALIQ